MIHLFAFCGFFVSGADAKLYNDASQVVLVRNGNHTVMTMSNNYKGPAEDFAMVVPVPVVLKKEQVKTLAPTVFDHVDELTAPRLVEYWETDPCEPDMDDDLASIGSNVNRGIGGKDAASHGVKILAKFEVGEYQILILSAKESGGLELWLREHKYRIPDGAAAALAPYIREQSKFFVAKVDAKTVKRDAHGAVVLSPLRFDFESSELRLPVRLGLLNAQGKQDLMVYVLAPGKRFEVANYKNVFIPTNLDVADEVRKAFGAFYAELFDATLAQAGGKAVVTEYSWDTSSCDPCPGPPLDANEIATLGGDSAAGRWVITRLHTRYDKQTLSDDLVFREAQPIVGGREGNWPSPVNNFQGRYIIRHYWTGKVACKDPQWNRWGDRSGGPTAARDLAAAPRGKMKLANVVDTPVPALGLAGHKHRRGK